MDTASGGRLSISERTEDRCPGGPLLPKEALAEYGEALKAYEKIAQRAR